MQILKVKIGDTTYYGKEALTLREQVTELQSRGIDSATLLAAYKTVKLNQLAENKEHHEYGGTTWNSYPVDTSSASQSKIGNSYLAAKNGLWADGNDFKFADGVYRPLTVVELINLAETVFYHVTSTMATEKAKGEQINAATDYAAVDAVDITF